VKAVMVFVAHETATATLDIYGHLWPDESGRIAPMCHQRAIGAM